MDSSMLERLPDWSVIFVEQCLVQQSPKDPEKEGDDAFEEVVLQNTASQILRYSRASVQKNTTSYVSIK